MDMRFGTRNVRSLQRADSLMAVAKGKAGRKETAMKTQTHVGK
jgi:hypothetical protein